MPIHGAACPSCGQTNLHATGCVLLGRQVRAAVGWTAALVVVTLIVLAWVRGPESAVTGIVGALASPMGAGVIIGLVAAAWWARRRSSK